MVELFEERQKPKNFRCGICKGSVLDFWGVTSYNYMLFGALRNKGGTEINDESNCGDVIVPVTSPIDIRKGM